MIYVGIDPGLKGALVAISNKEEIVLFTIMPTISNTYNVVEIISFFDELQGLDQLKVMIEKPIIIPAITSKKTVRLTSYFDGLIQGILYAKKIPFDLVGPRKWQTAILGTSKNDKHKHSIGFCQRNFPEFDLLPTPRSRKPHDGLSDALCIAIYNARTHRTFMGIPVEDMTWSNVGSPHFSTQRIKLK